jgi:hypothetical protein
MKSLVLAALAPLAAVAFVDPGVPAAGKSAFKDAFKDVFGNPGGYVVLCFFFFFLLFFFFCSFF